MNGNDRVQMVHLPVDNLTLIEYSSLFTTKSIIYDYLTEIFLVFQTDTMILVENKELIHHFLEYDYVGAPWTICQYYPTQVCGFIGNGGFSLRRKSKMLEIIEKIQWEYDNEDLYFSKNYEQIPLKKPTYEMAKTFSVEGVYCDSSFACHKPWMEKYYPQFIIRYPQVEQLRLLQSIE